MGEQCHFNAKTKFKIKIKIKIMLDFASSELNGWVLIIRIKFGYIIKMRHIVIIELN